MLAALITLALTQQAGCGNNLNLSAQDATPQANVNGCLGAHCKNNAIEHHEQTFSVPQGATALYPAARS